MNVNFFENVETVKSIEISDTSSEISDEDIYVFNNKQRFFNRISYFKKLKIKFQLPDKIEEMYLKLLNFMYYKSSVNHSYFIKKVCDYYNISCNIKNKVNKIHEATWNDFIKEIKIQ